MATITLLALFVLALASIARAQPAPFYSGTVEHRSAAKALARKKCQPRPEFLVHPARLIPVELRPRTFRVAVLTHVRLMYAGRRCLPVNPIGKPGTVILGRHMAAAYGWVGDQWECLHALWDELESRWYVYANNPSSSAYGIPQALPGSKMGAGWQHSARVQIRWGLGYVRGRYGTPCGALSFRLANGWY